MSDGGGAVLRMWAKFGRLTSWQKLAASTEVESGNCASKVGLLALSSLGTVGPFLTRPPGAGLTKIGTDVSRGTGTKTKRINRKVSLRWRGGSSEGVVVMMKNDRGSWVRFVIVLLGAVAVVLGSLGDRWFDVAVLLLLFLILGVVALKS